MFRRGKLDAGPDRRQIDALAVLLAHWPKSLLKSELKSELKPKVPLPGPKSLLKSELKSEVPMLAKTVIVNGELLSETAFASVTVRTMPESVSTLVGVPLMTPVLVFNDVPAGIAPLIE